MTYDPTDIAEGLIRRSLPTDPSPIGRLTRLLDGVIDDLMGTSPTEAQRGEARGLATALSILTCYTDDEVREQAMLRHADRHSTPSTEETHDDRTAPASARTGRRKRSPSRA